MMRSFSYVPLTAIPLRQNMEYQEIAPDIPVLSDYIRCFWGSAKPFVKKESTVSHFVIPDTCVDIIYYIDHTEETITSIFCGINDSGFWDKNTSGNGHLVSVFAVRFYAWGAYAFSEDSLEGTLNSFCEVSSRFHWLDAHMQMQLLEKRLLSERIRIAEQKFLQRMAIARQHSVLNGAVEQILWKKGTLSALQLAKECFISSRQLERLFSKYIGITPKKLANLVRYQFLWNEIMRNRQFSMLDAVVKYGFTDQSHLIREFKRYHSMDISSAKRYAYQNVENIQDFSKIF